MNRHQKLRLYIVTVGLVAAATLIASVLAAPALHIDRHVDQMWLAPFCLVVCWATSQRQVYIGDTNVIAMGTIGHMVAVILLPLPVALLVIAASKSISELSLILAKRTRTWRATVVNISATVLANAVGGTAFYFLHGSTYLWHHDVSALLALPALIALATLYHVIDILVVVGAISLSNQDPPWTVFRSLFKDMLLPQLSLFFVGIVFAILLHFSPFLSLLIMVPVLFSAQSFEAVARMRKETIDAVLKLAESIEFRDGETGDHSKRLSEKSRRLANALGLIPEHVNEIALAAQVHDLGKIGISSDILLKPGPLTPKERETMESHPIIGDKILAAYSAFQSSAPIVRHHHERWDGRGYPDKLKGEDIPIGSRIISVVDAYDAMTSNRPYRDGMPPEVAVGRLMAGMGAQFDPRVCLAYIQLLIDDGTYTPGEPSHTLHLVKTESTAS